MVPRIIAPTISPGPEMPNIKFTEDWVASVAAPAVGRIEYWDSTLPAFGLRVSDQGVKSWVVLYRVGVTKRRLTIGRYPAIRLHSDRKAGILGAKDLARKAMSAVAAGEDPAAEKLRRRRVDDAGVRTFEQAGAVFVERYAKVHQRRSWRETERILKVDIYPDFGPRPLTDITKPDLHALLDKLGDIRPPTHRDKGRGRTHRGGPMAARNAHKVLRKFFRWATDDRGFIDRNPMAGIAPPAPTARRDRVLSDNEIRTLWPVWVADRSPFGDVCRCLLLTGQRVREVGNMARTEVDGNDWVIGAARYKTGVPHLVPLTAPVREIIEARPRFKDCDLVFTNDGRPLGGWSEAKADMDAKSGVTNWQFRDLRRTARTILTRSGVDFSIAERVVGHVLPGVSGVYDRHSYANEKRHALETLATTIERILNPPADNIVGLRSAAGGTG